MKNQRLQTIADCVLENSIVADIGTDHAYLPCELISSGKALKCYACDIAEGPLNSAKETIKNARYEDKIETILCPGLKDVPSDANVAVIAGMGWMTAEKILEDDFDKLEQFDQILIQVNRDVVLLRKWLMEHHFPILLEKTVHEKMFYEIVGFNPKKKQCYSLSKEQLFFGTQLTQEPDEATLAHYRFVYKQNEAILSQLNPQSDKAKELLWQNHFLQEMIK